MNKRNLVLHLDSMSDRIVPSGVDYHWNPQTGSNLLASTAANWTLDGGGRATYAPGYDDIAILEPGSAGIIFDVPWRGVVDAGDDESHFSSSIEITADVVFTTTTLWNSTVTITSGKSLTIGDSTDNQAQEFLDSTKFQLQGWDTQLSATLTFYSLVDLETLSTDSQDAIWFHLNTLFDVGSITNFGLETGGGTMVDIANSATTIKGSWYMTKNDLIHRSEGDDDTTFLSVARGGFINCIGDTRNCKIDIPTWVQDGHIYISGPNAYLNFSMDWLNGDSVFIMGSARSSGNLQMTDGATLEGDLIDCYAASIKFYGSDPLTINADMYFSTDSIQFGEGNNPVATPLNQTGSSEFGFACNINMIADFDSDTSDTWNATGFTFGGTQTTISATVIDTLGNPESLILAHGAGATGFLVDIVGGYSVYRSPDGTIIGVYSDQ